MQALEPARETLEDSDADDGAREILDDEKGPRAQALEPARECLEYVKSHGDE